MEATDLRLGNLVLRAPSSDYKDWKETTVNLSYLELILQNTNDFKGIPLTAELLLDRCGFAQLPHFTILNSLIFDLGRGRFLSVACVGTPNEMLFITDDNKAVIVLRNYDYDGKTYLHHIQNFIFALTGTELTLKP